MSDTGAAKSKFGNVETKDKHGEEVRLASERSEQEQRDLNNVDAKEEQREEDRVVSEKIVQQDLNQGMDTGTHSSIHRGVNWSSAYQIHNTPSPNHEKKDEPTKASKE